MFEHSGFKAVVLFAGCGLLGAFSLSGRLLSSEPIQNEPVAIVAMPSLQLADRPPETPAFTEYASTDAPEDQTAASALNLSGLLEAMIQVESAGNPARIGRHGERGLLQLRPSTWNQVTERLYGNAVSFDRAFEPGFNRVVALAYLGELQAFLDARRGEWQSDERSLLLACYNCGPGRVASSGFDLAQTPMQTQDYVQRIGNLHDASAR